MNPERLPINFLDETLGEQERNARLERIIGPQVSMIPDDETSIPDDEASIPGGEASIPASKTLKKKPMLSGKGIVICAILSLATGIVVAAEWPSLSQNLKSYKHDILETNFVATSKSQPAQAAPPPAAVTAPELSAILNRLNAIEHSVNELAAAQEQIRKAQSDLAALQSRLVASQPVANAKQNKQSAPDVTAGRKYPRRDYRYIR